MAHCQRVVVFAFAAFSLAGQARAGTDEWTGTGPYAPGGFVQAIVVDPRDPSTLYAAAYGTGIFKSVDGGSTWSPSSHGLSSFSFIALAVSPASPSTVFAAGDGVFKSTDGGLNWKKASQALDQAIYSLVVDPTSLSTLYAGGEGKVFKSTDAGESWQAFNAGPSGVPIRALAVDPAVPSRLYAGTGQCVGVFRSGDAGLTWTEAGSLVTGGGCGQPLMYAIVVDPTSSSTVYVASRIGVFKSTNGGSSWESSSDLRRAVFSLALDPRSPATLYAGTLGGGVFKTTDGAVTWRAPSDSWPTLTVGSLAIDPLSSATVFAGTFASQGDFSSPAGIFKSTDGATTWTGVDAAFVPVSVRVLALTVEPGPVIYAGGRDLFRSPDGGSSWTGVNLGVVTPFVTSIAVDLASPSTVYVGTSKGAFKSTDGGATWLALDVRPRSNVGGQVELAIAKSDPEVLYASTDSAGILKSTDGGLHWMQPMNGGLQGGIGVLAVDPTNSMTVYASNQDGLVKTTNGGESWEQVLDSSQNTFISALAIDPQSPSTVFCGLYSETPGGASLGAVLKSSDGGAAWSGSAVGGGVGSIAMDSASPSTLYASTSGIYARDRKVVKSTDGGKSWDGVVVGLAPVGVTTLAVNPAASSTVYAGTSSGVFKITFARARRPAVVPGPPRSVPFYQ